MLISLNWIQQYLPTIDQVDAFDVAEKLSNSLAEVERIYRVGEGVSNIVIGEIRSIEKHPNADKLSVCQVTISEEITKQIICGAKNIKEGDKVPVCLPGGSVLDPEGPLGSQKSYQITEKELKGVNSYGMLCSPKELGIYDDHKGIMILSPSSQVGKDLTPSIKDTVLEIENKSLTHRPDCFSHLGIAREIAAIYNLEFQPEEKPATLTKTGDLDFKVEYKVDNNICKRFTAVSIQDVQVEPSPFWLQAKLGIVGIRPVNNIVDVSNYLMMDIGQPTHAFDYDKIKGQTIIIRTAKSNEELTTIDGQKRNLNKGNVVLADNSGLIAIPAIMGGLSTEINENTKNIILVAENWDMFAIRRTSRELGLRTEASTRFEKGLDPSNLDKSLKVTANMILDVATGEVASDVVDIYPEPAKEVEILFDLNSVPRVLGIDLTKERIVNILESLHIEVLGDEKIEENILNVVDQSNKIKLHIPSYRQDLKIKEDILEEIARIYGYYKFTPTLPTRSLTPVKKNQTQLKLKNLKRTLSKYGIDEIYTYSMIGEKLANKAQLKLNQNIAISNPLSPELSHVRSSLTASIIEKIQLNANNLTSFSLFEITKVAYGDQKNEEGLPLQPYHLAIGVYNSSETTLPDIKGYLEALSEKYDLDIQIENLKGENFRYIPDSYHPSQSGKIIYKGQTIGAIGNIHPKVKSNFGITGNVSLLEIRLDQILEDMFLEPNYEPISVFPAVYRDLSFWIGEKIEIGKILTSIKKSGVPFIEKLELMDIYESENKKSITFNVTLRALDKTLEEDDINNSINKIVEILVKEFKAEHRA